MHLSRTVDAAPFRAHFLHMCTCADAHWAVVAHHHNLPYPLIRQLLDVRPGHQIYRLTPQLARRILAIRVAPLKQLRATSVPSRNACRAIRRLVDHGWTLPTLARALTVPTHTLADIASGRSVVVNAYLDRQLAALVTPRAERRTGTAA